MADSPPCIAISGATGFVGRALCKTLTDAEAGIRIRRMVRRPPGSDADAIEWSPAQRRLDPADLEGVDAVVNLAGAPIGPAKWTKTRKREIADSRIEGTKLLVAALSQLKTPPKVIVQASAVGFYGHTADAWVDEDSPIGDGFLAGVVRDWEAAVRPLEARGVRVLRLRFGHVLGDGGLLGALRAPTRLGLGGRLGSGRQFWSFIGLGDLVAIIVAGLGDPRMSGVLNAVTPQPVRNTDFARQYAACLRRPAWVPAPATALRLVFGAEQAREMLLWGQRVRPAGLEQLGFQWTHPRLQDALTASIDGSMAFPVESARALVVAGQP
ncbi:MAG: TIGR01777 family oxidoreductase [Myxococcota bacterium]